MNSVARTSLSSESDTSKATQLHNGLLVLVEDDDEMAQALMWWFELQGYQAVHFASAESLMDQYRVDDQSLKLHYPPGTEALEPVICAIVDMNLPGMSGIELIHRLRTTLAQIGCILITAVHARDRARFGPLPDDVPTLTKPCDLQDLERAIQNSRIRTSTPGIESRHAASAATP